MTYRIAAWRVSAVESRLIADRRGRDSVYERLVPGNFERTRGSKSERSSGNERVDIIKLLTDDGGHPADEGHPALAQHLYAVIALMRTENKWEEFKKRVDVALPKHGANLQFTLMAADDQTCAELCMGYAWFCRK
jgi:hypothetical protein